MKWKLKYTFIILSFTFLFGQFMLGPSDVFREGALFSILFAVYCEGTEKEVKA